MPVAMENAAFEKAWSFEQLARVQVRLDAAMDALVDLRLSDSPGERDALLAEAAGLLKQVVACWEHRKASVDAAELGAEGRRKQLGLLLSGIQARASRLRQLNETALVLCRGWLSVTPPPIGSYTPDGAWVSQPEAGGLPIRA